MADPRLSVVITTRNRPQDVARCVKSVLDSNLQALTFELLVVDDASSPPLDAAPFAGATVKILRHDHRKMMAASRNTGARAAHGEWVVFIDDDNVLDPQMISTLVAFANSHPRFGILGPSMFLWQGKKRYLDYQTLDLFTGRTRAFLSPSPREFYSSHGIPNVFMVRRAVFETCGYFDELMAQTYSEPDLYYRAKKAGYECAVVNGAFTYHDVTLESSFSPRNLGGMYSFKAFCLMRNRTVVVWRYGSPAQKLVYLVLFSWVWPLVYSLLMLRYHKYDLIKLYWQGYAAGLRFVATGKLDFSGVKAS